MLVQLHKVFSFIGSNSKPALLQLGHLRRVLNTEQSVAQYKYLVLGSELNCVPVQFDKSYNSFDSQAIVIYVLVLYRVNKKNV